MKKLILKKADDKPQFKRIGYKINYEQDLNEAQYSAVMHNNGPALVIAGAGTGKTRTLIYRVSRMVEDGVPPESILLLTFTRKSSAEMLRRASLMLDGRCENVSGGTFHSFALLVLRQFSKLIGYDERFTVLDQSDTTDTINLLRTQMKLDAGKRRFPRKETLHSIFNLAVNRLQPVSEIILKDYPFFVDEIENIEKLFEHFKSYKKKYSLMDYDDMLENLLVLCRTQESVRDVLYRKYKYLMVDEYQDTNKLQHEIVMQVAGPQQNIMAVGDDAQSIYSFRGANYENIMTFPNYFDDCKIFKVEENYRSTQPILDLTNKIISYSPQKYEKELFSSKISGELPKIIIAENERQQSEFVAQQVLELREEGIALEDMAVLARSGFHTFDLEIELSKANIPYLKFGGLKFIETAHIKDVLAFIKVLFNNKDAISWNRILLLHEGIGPRSSSKIIDMLMEEKITLTSQVNAALIPKNRDSVENLIIFLQEMYNSKLPLSEKVQQVINYYSPIMKDKYDDWKKRKKDIDTLTMIAERYKSMNDFLNDMALEPPVESVEDVEQESKEEEFLTLSTVHSAKGLEWKVVFIIWALDGRFPSSKSIEDLNSIEEERRLFYVAATRAKEQLFISYPINIFDRESGVILSKPSRFIDGIDESIAERYVLQSWEAGVN